MAMGKMKYLPNPFLKEFNKLKREKGITKDRIAFYEVTNAIKVNLELERLMGFGKIRKYKDGK